jgi:hypothetical protein
MRRRSRRRRRRRKRKRRKRRFDAGRVLVLNTSPARQWCWYNELNVLHARSAKAKFMAPGWVSTGSPTPRL